MIGCVTSCVVKCEEQGLQLEMRQNMTPGITEQSNDAGTSIGGAGVGYVEKAGRTPCVIERSNAGDTCIGSASRQDVEKAGSVHSIDSRQCYETEVEKRKFICESFKLDSNAILNKDAELKEDVIKLFLDNFEVLAMHPSQYGETNVLEMKIDLIPGAVP